MDDKMIVTRWQAPVLPSPEQVKMIFQAEGLTPTEEILAPKTVIPDHRHPFDEIRMVLSGRLILNISGNQLLLRAGDRIDIPANTRHSKSTEGTEACVCVVANRPF
jgi:quercetin dioxygenase-like cupin family protein